MHTDTQPYMKLKFADIGVVMLSTWFFLNLLPGIGSLFFILLGNHAPALHIFFEKEEIKMLDNRILNTIDGLAVLANTLIMVYCSLAFVVVRKLVMKKEKILFGVLATGAILLQAAGYFTDYFFGGENFLILNISSFFLIIGLGLCARALFIIR